MKLKTLTLNTLGVAILGTSGLFGVAALSFAVSGGVLFAASPFVSDSSEDVIKGWMSRSGEMAVTAGLMSAICALMHSQLGSKGEDADMDEDCPVQPHEPAYAAPALDRDAIRRKVANDLIPPPFICTDCLFLNLDASTRDLLLCGVRSEPEQDYFCPDFCPDKPTKGGRSDA